MLRLLTAAFGPSLHFRWCAAIGPLSEGSGSDPVGEIGAAFEAIIQRRASAILVANDPFFFNRATQFVVLAARHAIPTLYWRREFAAAGGLISYGPDQIEQYRVLGVYATRILKGEKPGDLPVQLPTRFELVINLMTAKTLGIDVPTALLARADEVIE